MRTGARHLGQRTKEHVLATKIAKKRLGDVLLEQELIEEAQLKECISIQRQSGGSLASVLVSKGYLDEEDLVVTLSEQLGIPHIRVAHYNIPQEVLDEVPETHARQYEMLPVSVTGDVLTLAMADPLNIMALDDLRMLTSYEIEPVVAVQSELQETIEKHYGAGKKGAELYDELIGSSDPDAVENVEEGEDVSDISQMKADAEDAPVIRLVNLILMNALELGASVPSMVPPLGIHCPPSLALLLEPPPPGPSMAAPWGIQWATSQTFGRPPWTVDAPTLGLPMGSGTYK